MFLIPIQMQDSKKPSSFPGYLSFHPKLWVKINLFNEVVICALDLAHVKVRRLRRSRGRPKYKSVEPN